MANSFAHSLVPRRYGIPSQCTATREFQLAIKLIQELAYPLLVTEPRATWSRVIPEQQLDCRHSTLLTGAIIRASPLRWSGSLVRRVGILVNN